MKIYNLGVLIESRDNKSAAEIMTEILLQVEKDGPEAIACPVTGKVPHEVIKQAKVTIFPDCLTQGTSRLAFAIALPTKKDLGRRWFLKRLEGDNKSSYRLIATTDVSVIHIEAE